MIKEFAAGVTFKVPLLEQEAKELLKKNKQNLFPLVLNIK